MFCTFQTVGWYFDYILQNITYNFKETRSQYVSWTVITRQQTNRLPLQNHSLMLCITPTNNFTQLIFFFECMLADTARILAPFLLFHVAVGQNARVHGGNLGQETEKSGMESCYKLTLATSTRVSHIVCP